MKKHLYDDSNRSLCNLAWWDEEREQNPAKTAKETSCLLCLRIVKSEGGDPK